MSAEFFRGKTLYAREQVTVSTTSIGGTAATMNNTSGGQWSFNANAAYVEVISNDIYYTIDGSTPSSTNGNRLAAGQFLILTSKSKVQNFRAVRGATGVDAVIDISYYTK